MNRTDAEVAQQVQAEAEMDARKRRALGDAENEAARALDHENAARFAAQDRARGRRWKNPLDE